MRTQEEIKTALDNVLRNALTLREATLDNVSKREWDAVLEAARLEDQQNEVANALLWVLGMRDEL